MDSKEIRERLGRPRRFMLTLSLAIIVWAILGAETKPDVEQFGFALKFVHPNRLAVCLFLIWLWSVVRYLQFVYELLSEVKTDVLQDVRAEEIRLVLKAAKRRVLLDAKEGTLGGRGYRDARILEMREEPFMIRQGEPNRFFLETEDGGRVYERLGLRLEWFNLKAQQVERLNTNYALTLSRRQVRMLTIKSVLLGSSKLPAFGDHVVPLLVAVIAFGFGLNLIYDTYQHSKLQTVVHRVYREELVRQEGKKREDIFIGCYLAERANVNTREIPGADCGTADSTDT